MVRRDQAQAVSRCRSRLLRREAGRDDQENDERNELNIDPTHGDSIMQN